jgi:hypothetical protein
MKRRRFIAAMDGTALSRPKTPFAQPPLDRVLRVGFLATWGQNAQDSQRRVAAFQQALQELG